MSKPALSSRPAQHRSRMRAACPHCGTASAIRSSRRITAVYSELYFICPNEACGHVWVASLGVLHTLHPSATPNPEVQIPFAAGRDPAAKAAAAG
jgi:hypothetical protein